MSFNAQLDDPGYVAALAVFERDGYPEAHRTRSERIRLAELKALGSLMLTAPPTMLAESYVSKIRDNPDVAGFLDHTVVGTSLTTGIFTMLLAQEFVRERIAISGGARSSAAYYRS